MANNPKKAQDATEAAMAAIQEALTVRDAEMKAAAASKPAPEPRKAASEPPASTAAVIRWRAISLGQRTRATVD